MMRKAFLTICLVLSVASMLPAAETQGLIADWNCADSMVKNGRQKTLKDNRSCSLMHDYKRAAYGLITDDKKIYKLDDPNNEHILQLLEGTPDKDNLKVVVTGDIEDGTIKVVNISML